MEALPPYAELSCQSAFSFLRGACDPEALVARAVELGYAGLALTDGDGARCRYCRGAPPPCAATPGHGRAP